MQNKKRQTPLHLTFALSSKGMAAATEIDPGIRPITRATLLEMRAVALRLQQLMALFRRAK